MEVEEPEPDFRKIEEKLRKQISGMFTEEEIAKIKQYKVSRCKSKRKKK